MASVDRHAQEERLRFQPGRSPVTTALLAAFALVFVAGWFDFDHRILLSFAKVNDRVRAGEVWRLFTASFLHAGLLHIWFNGTSLVSIGPTVERVYGRLQFLLAFLVGGAAGMACSVLFVPQPSVGASAGIFALLGLILANAVRFRASLPPMARRRLVVQVLVVVGLNVVLGLLVGFVDNAAHLGGLLGGFALGFLLRPQQPLVPPSLEREALRPDGAPALVAHRRGRSYLGWAGQRWKAVAFVLGLAPWALVPFRSDHFPGWEFLAFFVGAAAMASARCPKCRERVFWYCVSKLPASRGLDTAFRSEACPICRYPDEAPSPEARVPPAAAPVERAPEELTPGGFFERTRRG